MMDFFAGFWFGFVTGWIAMMVLAIHTVQESKKKKQ